MFTILDGKPMTGKTEFMLATLEDYEYDFVIIIHLVHLGQSPRSRASRRDAVQFQEHFVLLVQR